jgi:hypothetical protein
MSGWKLFDPATYVARNVESIGVFIDKNDPKIILFTGYICPEFIEFVLIMEA